MAKQANAVLVVERVYVDNGDNWNARWTPLKSKKQIIDHLMDRNGMECRVHYRIGKAEDVDMLSDLVGRTAKVGKQVITIQ